jgi:divalent metal cation (Fe/Co/Zn/Cd) transporter
MNEFEQREQAGEPLHEFNATFPGHTRRRVVMGVIAAGVVVVLIAWTVLFVHMNHKIEKTEQVNAAQAAQIHQLQTRVASVDASLGAAVACLQTVGSLEGLCSKLVK